MDVEFLKQRYFELDCAVPFLDTKINSIIVKDYYNFYYGIETLMFEKNKDPLGIQYCYLDYLLKKIEADTTAVLLSKFFTILELVFKVENGIYCTQCGHFRVASEISELFNSLASISDVEEFEKEYTVIKTCPNCKNEMKDVITYGFDEENKGFVSVKDVMLTKETFEEFRQIVCYQNMPNYNEDYIDPELEEDIKEMERLKNKNIVFPSLEKQLCCVVAGSSYKIDELKILSLRKFILLLNTIDTKLHYQIYKMNENSGAVTFKGGLDHWIYEAKKNKFEGMISLDSFKEKMKQVAK